MNKLRKKELVIGATVIVTLAILFFGIDYLKGINIFRASNYYFTTFHSVEGLAQSAPVTLDGFKVGIVREINYEYDHPGNVRVELSLNSKLRLPEDSRAVLSTDLLGTGTIQLHLGSSPRLAEIGATIAGENASGLMQSVSDNIMPRLAEMAPKIDSLLSGLVALVSDPSLRASLRSIETITANLETSSRLLHSAMQPVPGITAGASEAMTDVKAIAVNLNRVSDDLAQLSTTLRSAPIDSVIGNFNILSEHLLAVSRQLDSRDSSLGLLLNDPELYNNLNACAAHIDTILVDLQRTPKRYIPPIKIF